MRDLRHAFRVLLKKPGFTSIAILTLALGIGANSTIFSLIEAVLLRPLPYAHPERIVNLWTSYPASQGQPDIFSPPNYLDVAARSRTFEAVGAYDTGSFTLASAGQPENLAGLRMSASMSRVLGVEPQIGRWFTQAEDDAGEAVTVLSDGLWRNRFGADASVLGRSLLLNGKAWRVIGVLPPGTGFPSLATTLYVPISFTADDRSSRGNVTISAAARLRAGVSQATAEAELHTIAASLAQIYAEDRGIQMGAVSMRENLVGNARALLVVLWAAVALMLAVGCANVANLFLTDAAGRQREFAIRRSLGATNGRLARQLLTESLLLAGCGGAVGLTLAFWAVPLMASRLPQTFPHLHALTADPAVLLYTLGVTLLTGLLFGLAPSLGLSRRNLAAAIREGDVRSGRGVTYRRLGRALVVGEIGLVLVLMVGAGLVLRSLAALSGVNPGFRSSGLVVWQLFPPPARYAYDAARQAFYRRVVAEVSSLPGVRSAALVNPLPFGPVDITIDGGFRIAGRPDPAPDQMPQSLRTRVSPGYFAAMGIPLRGREFTDRDGKNAPGVAIVSETLARRYFAGEDPLGKHLLLGRQRLDFEIVGVAGDVRHINLRAEVRPELYISMAAFPAQIAGLVVRGSGDAAALLPAIERRVWSVDSGMAANLAAPVDSLLYASMSPARIAAVLLGIFAVTTLLLGLAGIYGVLSYAISQRQREFGIRLALGAAPRDVLRMVLGEAFGLAIAGVAVGGAAALGFTHYLDSLLFGVRAADPATYLVAGLGVAIAALLAAYTPARRAMRVDPAGSLRSE